MNINNHYFLQTDYISCAHDRTDLLVFGNLILIKKPIYHIPVHIFLASIVCAWRDSGASDDLFSLVSYRITSGLALGALAIVGVVDALSRIAIAVFAFIIPQSKVSSKLLFVDAFFGLSQSLHFASDLQIWNLMGKKLSPYILYT